MNNNHINFLSQWEFMKFARNGSFGCKEHEEIVFEFEHEEMVSGYYDKSSCIG